MPTRYYAIKYMIKGEHDHSATIKNALVETQKTDTVVDFFNKVSEDELSDVDGETVLMDLINSKEIDEDTFKGLEHIIDPVLTDRDFP